MTGVWLLRAWTATATLAAASIALLRLGRHINRPTPTGGN